MMRILYITKLSDRKANGVTVSVTQLINSICNYADILWLDLSGYIFKVSDKVKKVNIDNYLTTTPDIAVFEDPFNTTHFCKIAKVLRKNGIPYIITPHGCFHREALKHNHLKKVIAMSTVFRGFLHGCYGIQYLCENEKINSYSVNESIIISNGIPDYDEYRIRRVIKDIVFISRKAVNHKGLDLLLQSLKSVKGILLQKGVQVHLYGSVETEADESYISKTIDEFGLGEIVDNNGPIFDAEKKAALLKADLFILTSRHEGFPMSILEAFTYGLPVLITDRTNMGDIVTSSNAGWVCKATIEDISKTIIEALETDDCTEMSMNAKKVGSQYSWDKISEYTVEVYRKITQEKRSN